mmetsp:Transcript_5486/g.6038  ORF Transcript_5486/g.6038 Transcript_5486/m.6038 type:complete len:266 (+) Transcript_5486:85-882(+)
MFRTGGRLIRSCVVPRLYNNNNTNVNINYGVNNYNNICKKMMMMSTSSTPPVATTPAAEVSEAETETMLPSPSPYMSTSRIDVDLEKAPFVHYRTPNGPNPKFKSPRKRANILFHELNVGACEKIRNSKPEVFVPLPSVQTGDAVEIEVVNEGGINTEDNRNIETCRGVVIGMANKGLDSYIHILDFLEGMPIERKLPYFSPVVKSLKLLDKNFVYKKKRKVKRAKLYFLKDRNPKMFTVTQKKKKPRGGDVDKKKKKKKKKKKA